MHKTAREILFILRDLDEDEALGPCYGIQRGEAAEGLPLDSAIEAWREAGHPIPNQDEPEPEQGTCWTCRWAYGNACNEPTPAGLEKCASIFEWANRLESPMPPRDYSGPPCPGWEPRR
jgi:hypothetical protein